MVFSTAPTGNIIHAPTRSRDEMVSAARKKLKTFRAKQTHSPMSSAGTHVPRRSHSRGSSMGLTAESTVPVVSEATRHAKRRSHSRSASILSLNTENNLPSMTLSTFNMAQLPESSPSNLGGLNRSFSFGGPKTRPTSAAPVMVSMPTSPIRAQHIPTCPRPSSHHRRRSSVSTRRESADMMGFDPAALKALKSIGENDKDDVTKIRERALLALEGKGPRFSKSRTVPELVSNIGFSKVEIPDWNTPDVERTFDWGMDNAPVPFSIGLNNTLTGKRDSFGKNLIPAVSTKAELSVLLEEEEEEEDVETGMKNVVATQSTIVLPIPESRLTPLVESPTPELQPSRSPSPNGRPRPASLDLKALALTSSTVALPTPSPTPSPGPRSLPGMKPLNLGTVSYAAHRQSMIALGGSPSRISLPPSRRQSLRSESRESVSTSSSRDSATLSTLVNRLPLTPSTMSPTSMNSAAASVEGFLQKNQELLISRIEQLERALSKSKRMSVASDASCSSSTSLAEEQITLIAELKIERNTLVEDIANWRTRVANLEHQASLYADRAESERRETFAARERVRELEAERNTWEADRIVQNEKVACAREDAAAWRAKYEEASKGECRWQAKAVNFELDIRRLEMELATARRTQQAHSAPATPPNKRWNVTLAPHRLDGSVSSASTADVDEVTSYTSGDVDGSKIKPRVLPPLPNMDVVVEEDEESYGEPDMDGDEDEESRCVEEDEDDVASDILDEVNEELSASYSMGSFTSPEARRVEPQSITDHSVLSPNFKFPPATPVHVRTGSMIKGWQMPRGPVADKGHSPTKPDRFFDQLEHLYASSDEDLTISSNLSSPDFNMLQPGTFKGDGGASAFTFGTKRSSVALVRGHGTRASRASISIGAFDGSGMPPFLNPKPEWIVRSDSAEPALAAKLNAPISNSPKVGVQAKSVGSDVTSTLQGQEYLAGDSCVSQTCLHPAVRTPEGGHCFSDDQSDDDPTPRMTKPPTFTAAPISPSPKTSSVSSCSSSHMPERRKPSLTRAQPTGRAPPRVPVDPSYDKSRSPFSVSYSRTSSRTSGSRLSTVEAAAIEAAITQARAQAQAQQQSRLTLAGLTSLIPWGTGATSAAKSTLYAEQQRPSTARKENGSVSREAQLERLRHEIQTRNRLSGPCCSRCKSDVIQL